MGRKENLTNAKNIFSEIMRKISSDKEEWKEFLKFSSKFYKYSFTENLLMYAQNKDVTMCATLEEWNSIGRWVKPKSQSIKILKDAENNTYLEYVFDVKDTYARTDIPNSYTDEKLKIFKWQASENETIDILKDYLNYENVDTLREIISIYIADEIDNAGLLNGLSEDEENIVLKPEFMELLVKNTMFQLSTRCGIPIENEDSLFNEYEQIANPMAINILGNCVNHCSEDLLRIVKFKVKQNKIDNFKNEKQELKNILTDGEMENAQASTLNSFYTNATVVDSMYLALQRMGFKGGNILEPSAGIGNFLGRVPTQFNSKFTAIEIDNITGRILKQLYQKENVYIQGFEKTELEDNFYDVAISNVPFGNYSVFDKRYNKENFKIHDYFFAKSLDKVRNGGIIAFVTTKGTMDKMSSDFRKYIAQRADLLGAIK